MRDGSSYQNSSNQNLLSGECTLNLLSQILWFACSTIKERNKRKTTPQYAGWLFVSKQFEPKLT